MPNIETYEYDTNYFESFNSKLALRLMMSKRIEQFSLKNNLDGNKYQYKSNERYGLGVGFTYKSLAIGMSLSPDFIQRDTDRFGATKEFNLKGGVYLKRNVIDGYFRRYKGFYVANPSAHFPEWKPGLPYPQRADIRTIGWGVNYTVPFNWRKYSPKVIFVLDGKLKKSVGSFIAVSSIYVYNLKADSSIVDATFSTNAQIDKFNITLLSQLFGYYYTFVHKDFYASLSALPGITIPVGSVHNQDGKEHPRFAANFKLMTRAGVGYNSHKWYAGAYFIFDNNKVSLPSNLVIGNTLGEFRLFIGYRIKAPKMADRVMGKR